MIIKKFNVMELVSNRNTIFSIPPYQRNYVWSTDQCKVFLEDVTETASNTIRSNLSTDTCGHFFGSIVYIKKTIKETNSLEDLSEYILVDGQQRITTTMLFLAAIRDVLGSENIPEIDSEYLKNHRQKGVGAQTLKLKQVESDSLPFNRIINSDLESLTDEDKQTCIYQNYYYFINELRRRREIGEEIVTLCSSGLAYFTLVMIELVPDENPGEDPQEIFETMNSLGTSLILEDFVRNYVLSKLDSNHQDGYYKKYWLEIEKTIPGYVSYFIRDFMQMKTSSPFADVSNNSKLLYRKFKSIFLVKGSEESEPLLKELLHFAKLYACVLAIKEKGRTGNDRIDMLLKDLVYLKVKTANPFVLELLHLWNVNEISDQDVIDILEAFRTYCIRKRITKGSGGENKHFPLLNNMLPQLKMEKDKKQAFFDIIGEEYQTYSMPSDDAVAHALKLPLSNSLVKLLLSLIEEHLTKIRPEIDNSQVVQLEHIMPRKLTDKWRRELGSNADNVHSDLINNIGNLTLISRNQELGTKQFAEKRKIYTAKSSFQISKTMITHDVDGHQITQWDSDAIQSRNDWLCEILLNDIIVVPDKLRTSDRLSLPDFSQLGLIGKSITFIKDKSIQAVIISGSNVEYEGDVCTISRLTYNIMSNMGRSKKSTYNGYDYWEYNGVKLSTIRRDAANRYPRSFAKQRQPQKRLSFSKAGLIGKTLKFIHDPKFQAQIVDDQLLEFENKRYRLSPLTRELFRRIGKEFISRKPLRHWECECINLALLIRDSAHTAPTNGDTPIE